MGRGDLCPGLSFGDHTGFHLVFLEFFHGCFYIPLEEKDGEDIPITHIPFLTFQW